MGVRATIEQTECLRQGGELCRYIITPAVSDERWLGGRSKTGEVQLPLVAKRPTSNHP